MTNQDKVQLKGVVLLQHFNPTLEPARAQPWYWEIVTLPRAVLLALLLLSGAFGFVGGLLQ